MQKGKLHTKRLTSTGDVLAIQTQHPLLSTGKGFFKKSCVCSCNIIFQRTLQPLELYLQCKANKLCSLALEVLKSNACSETLILDFPFVSYDREYNKKGKD